MGVERHRVLVARPACPQGEVARAPKRNLCYERTAGGIGVPPRKGVARFGRSRQRYAARCGVRGRVAVRCAGYVFVGNRVLHYRPARPQGAGARAPLCNGRYAHRAGDGIGVPARKGVSRFGRSRQRYAARYGVRGRVAVRCAGYVFVGNGILHRIPAGVEHGVLRYRACAEIPCDGGEQRIGMPVRKFVPLLCWGIGGLAYRIAVRHYRPERSDFCAVAAKAHGVQLFPACPQGVGAHASRQNFFYAHTADGVGIPSLKPVTGVLHIRQVKAALYGVEGGVGVGDAAHVFVGDGVRHKLPACVEVQVTRAALFDGIDTALLKVK